MRRVLAVFAFCFFVLGLSFPAFAAPKVVIKLGHIAEAENPYGKGAEHFAALVEEKTGGEVEVKIFPNSQLGGQKDLIEGLIFGTVDMALVNTAALGQFQPQISLFDLPFLFDDRPHAYRSLDSVGMDVGKSLEGRGIKLLGYMENGIRHMTDNIRPIRTPEDMKGLKIRVQTNKIHIEMIKALGASPTPMDLSELYSALQQGTVDGQENPSAHIYTKRYYEVQKYASLTAHAYSPEPMIVSMRVWNKMTDAQRAGVEAAAKEAIIWQRKLSEDEDEAFWDKIRATGKMEVVKVDREPFRQATKPVVAMFEGVVGKDNLARIEALRTH